MYKNTSVQNSTRRRMEENAGEIEVLSWWSHWSTNNCNEAKCLYGTSWLCFPFEIASIYSLMNSSSFLMINAKRDWWQTQSCILYRWIVKWSAARDCWANWINDYLWNFWFILKLISTKPFTSWNIPFDGKAQTKKNKKCERREENAAATAVTRQGAVDNKRISQFEFGGVHFVDSTERNQAIK